MTPRSGDTNDPLPGRLTTFARLGPYEILGLLGAGGMGDVYRGRDERLGRDVAIKLLPEAASTDPIRLRRFEQEAKAAGTLNHPNLVTVFDIGSKDGRPYIVLELVEGPTLRRVLEQGPLPIRQAVDYAAQMARGLAAAHERGIVHRDLKPDNVLVTRDGQVKIVDFGLAKLTPALDSGSTTASTMSELTGQGALLGTAGYMSPEQVKGSPADLRSDLFAWGAVLYEMLSGRRAFMADTPAETMAAILKSEPPNLQSMRPDVPPAVAALIARCLEKLPEQRFQSARDVTFALEAVATWGAAPQSTTTPEGRKRRLAAAGAVGLATVVIVIGIRLWSFRSKPATIAGAMRMVPLTSYDGIERGPAFSPDGRQVAFAWNGGGDNMDIYVQLIGAGSPLRLTINPARDEAPTWSPDGAQIAFTRLEGERSALYSVPALGGTERRLAQLHLATWYSLLPAAHWSPAGGLLAFPDRPQGNEPPAIHLLSTESLTVRQLTHPPALSVGDWSPRFSPNGRSVAFTRASTEGGQNVLYVASVPGEELTRVTSLTTAVFGFDWASDGRRIVYSAPLPEAVTIALWIIPAAGGTPTRMPQPPDSFGSFSLSPRGQRLVYDRVDYDANLWRLGLRGGRPTGAPVRLVSSTLFEADPQISPDGQRIAFQSMRAGRSEIWVCHSDGSQLVQITAHSDSVTGSPRWSPDGAWLAFDTRTQGQSDIYVVRSDGGPPRRLTVEASNDVVPSWSSDGRSIYFSSNRSGTRQVWKTSVAGGMAEQVTKRGGFAAFESLDGLSVYYSKFDEPGIWRVPTGGGDEELVTPGLPAGHWGNWALGREGIYFLTESVERKPTLEYFSFASRLAKAITSLQLAVPITSTALAVSPDESWILYAQMDRVESDLVLIEDFPQPTP